MQNIMEVILNSMYITRERNAREKNRQRIFSVPFLPVTHRSTPRVVAVITNSPGCGDVRVIERKTVLSHHPA